VDKAKTAVMINVDGSALLVLLGKFALQLRVETNFCQCHLVNGDALSRFGCDENLVISLGFLAMPGKLHHCPKDGLCTWEAEPL
jgi:hypothetical protein